MGKVVNKKELSEILGFDERSLTEWQAEDPPMPIQERGERRGQAHKYDTAAVIDWLVQRQLRSAQAETPRDRLARLQSDEIELRLAEKRGQLVPADKVEPMWAAMVASARAFLRAESPRLAQLLQHTDGVEAKRDLLTETLDEFLTKLSGYDPSDEPERLADAAGAAAPLPDQAGAAA